MARAIREDVVVGHRLERSVQRGFRGKTQRGSGAVAKRNLCLDVCSRPRRREWNRLK